MYNGSCFDFDGTDDLVLTNNAVITGTGDFTLTAWINRATVNTYDYVCGNYGSGNTGGIEVYGKTNGTVILYIGAALTTSTVMTADTWYHFAATRTSGVCKLYMNGVLDVSGTLAGSIVGSNNFSIGNAADYTSENFDGKIADVKAFNVALSAANIKELYDDSKVIIPTKNAAAGGFVSQTNLIGWWPLAEGAGDICYDGSGNGYHGIVSNEDGDEWLTGQTGCPQLVEGYNRKAVFEDSTDYVTAAGPVVTGDLSVSAWIYRFSDTLFYAGVVAKMGGSSTNGWMFRFDTSHQLEFMILRSGVFTGEGSVTLSNNTWHHVVGTNDGTNLKVYVDGSLGSTVASGGATIDSGTGLQIGTYGYGGANTYPFYGIVDEVIVYDKALSLVEVQALAATGPNGGPLPPDPMTVGGGVAEAINAKSSNAVMSTYSYGGTTYKTWTYRTSGTFVVPQDIDVDVVVVGGGGGGGYNVGGGGGAGGLVSESLTAVASTYTVTVGAGGLGRYDSMSPPQCTSGGNSSISIASATTAVGGGRAGGYITSWSDAALSGGSGGGGRHSQAGAAGTAGQGNAGGSGTASGGQYAGGGGGGAGAVGANAVFSSPTIAGGDGGNGKNDFINSSVAETAALLAAALPTVGGGYLAGGGGGSRQGTGTIGAGGLGGGGKGSYYSTADGESGQVNTGGGGGAEKDGGSGVVIIRYAVPTPVGYWRNDGNVTWTDRSGNGNTGTVTGSPDTLLFKQGYNGSASTSTGRDGQGFPLKYQNNGAVGFNASNSYIDLGSDPSESGRVFSESAFTVSAWVKSANTVPGGGATDIQNIVGFPANNVGHLCIYTDGKLGIWSYGGGAWRFSNTPLTSNQWHHVVLVFDGDDGAFYYLDGVADSAELEFGGTAYQKECNLRYIGTFAPSRYFNGQIANVQVYNRALTQTEIKQNFATQASRFQVPRSIVTDGLVLNLDAGNPGSYPGSGTAWYDVSGNGCDFTLDGSGITYSSSNGGIFTLADGGASTTSAITANTSCTLVFWMKTTEVQALFWSGPTPGGHYLGAYRITNKFYNAGVFGSPTFHTNTVQRSNIYDVIRTNEWMMMEFKSVNMSSITANHFNQYPAYTFGNGAVGKIMIYNRTLTNAESAQNFRVDRERFGV
jgi:hypothetical protein